MGIASTKMGAMNVVVNQDGQETTVRKISMNVKHSLTLALVMADVLILGGTTPARVTKDGKAGDARKALTNVNCSPNCVHQMENA